MSTPLFFSILILSFFTFLCFGLQWQGLDWNIKNGNRKGPGPNDWLSDNVWVDNETDWLHLTITNSGSTWYCAEIYTNDPLPFGRYQWHVKSPLDFNENVVLGLFFYGDKDFVNEIDIEFTKGGNANNPNNAIYNVYPATSGNRNNELLWNQQLSGTHTTQRIEWTSQSVKFWSIGGHYPINTTVNVIQNWKFAPTDHINLVPQKNMRLHMNLWLVRGNAPSDGQSVEVIITGVQNQTII